jgi:hypothetical protein
MFLSEEDLELKGKGQNFFYAREILGGIRVFDETGSFQRFLDSNRWVFDFFPSYFADEERLGFSIGRSPRWRRRQSRLERLLSGPLGDLLEYAARKTQYRQMVKSTPGAARRMGPTRIMLHKSDNRPPILNRYEQNVRHWLGKYEQPMKKEKKAKKGSAGS